MKICHVFSFAMLAAAPQLSAVPLPAMHPANRVRRQTPAEQKREQTAIYRSVHELIAAFLDPNNRVLSWNCFWQKMLPVLAQQQKLQPIIPTIKQISSLQFYDASTILKLLPLMDQLRIVVIPLLSPETQKLFTNRSLEFYIQLMELRLQLNGTQKTC